jgi:Ran GTPase-activating protein (RanGAP) involved in mRNA processing and transport
MYDVSNMVLLHHGEVQSGGGMFRKRSSYLVLTHTYLLRFKSQVKAAESFSAITSSLGRTNTNRHSRLSSAGSIHEGSAPFAESCTGIPLDHVVAIYKLDDGKPYFTIEIAHLDEESNQSTTMSLQLNDPREADLWLSSIRAAITKSRLADPAPPLRKTVEYLVKAVEYECDYDPNHFRMFKVVQRATKSGGRSSAEDLTKITSNICYLVIGIQKLHLIPLPRAAKYSSTSSLSEFSGVSHGIAALTSVFVQSDEDAFQLAFRIPFQQTSNLYLASSSVSDITLWLRQAADFLRPAWLEVPFNWQVPRSIEDSLLPVPHPDEDHLCFDRTLTAYCVGYNVDPSQIRYSVDYMCEDAPNFVLLTPSNPRRSKYTALELLCIMRALRYNETFYSITFNDIDLGCLHGLYDHLGSEHMLWTTRSGTPLKLPQKDQSWLLVQELQSLVLKSKRLRRLSFSGCLSRRPNDEGDVRDPGSGICEAIFPLCAQQLTNVDWITLNGINLAEIDIDYIYAAAIEKVCHFRAIDLGRCNLVDQSLKTVMQGLVHQEETLESIDISGNAARLNPEVVGRQISRFQRIRKLNLSNSQLCVGLESIVESSTLLQWKLEEVHLSRTALNEESITALQNYLAHDQSSLLRTLQLDQCQLSGKAVAGILQAMSSRSETPRNLHLYVSENKLELGHDKLVQAFGRSLTPTHITMQMLEYTNEQNYQNIICALGSNTSLKYLDISRTSLPMDAGEETCHVLKHMLEENDTLEELNISGEETHLEAVTLGPGLRDALKGLEKNRSIKVFRVEHQVLGLPGANALATILEKNSTLRELYCEDNGINLQAFTALVNAMKTNTTVYYLPDMDKDRAWSRQRVDREIESLRDSVTLPTTSSTKGTVRRAFSGAIIGGRSLAGRGADRSANSSGYSEQDIQAAVASLDQRWNAEVARLRRYLRRNYCLAHGLPLDEEATSSPVGPFGIVETDDSLSKALELARLDRTPMAEFDLQLGHAMDFSEKALPPTPSDGELSKSEEEYSEKLIDVEEEDYHDGGLMMAP